MVSSCVFSNDDEISPLTKIEVRKIDKCSYENIIIETYFNLCEPEWKLFICEPKWKHSCVRTQMETFICVNVNGNNF